MTDTEARLAEIEGRLAAATPGPWKVSMGDIVQLTDAGKGYPLDHYPDSADVVVCGSNQWNDYLGVQRDEDATLIAHAPADIAWLVQEVRRLRAREEDLECAVHELNSYDVDAETFSNRMRIAALEAGLRKYGRHANNCPATGVLPRRFLECTCGYDALLAGTGGG